MTKFAYLLLLTIGLTAVCSEYSRSDRWQIREQETIEKTLTLAQSPTRLVVDNVEGYVHVTGVSGSQVHVTALKTIRAETDSDFTKAKQEVSLDISQEPGAVSVYYKAPWRCDGQTRNCDGDHRRFYSVSYDIDVQVPRSARAVLSSINGGQIRLNGTSGDFEVNGINGGIALDDVSGSGDVHTVNGPVSVHFAKNPARASSFRSINGGLDIYFQPDLSAELEFKTFNGGVYSDFDVLPGLAPAGEAEVHDGKFVYRSRGSGHGRVGNGGPQLSFNTLNGTIKLHREH